MSRRRWIGWLVVAASIALLVLCWSRIESWLLRLHGIHS